MNRFLITLLLFALSSSVALAASRSFEEIHQLENILQSEIGMDQINVDAYMAHNQFPAKVIKLFPVIRAINSDQADMLRLRLAEYLGDRKLQARDDSELTPVSLKSGVGALPPMTAQAFVIYDPVTDRVLLQDQMGAVRSIASISKLFTAMVALDSFPDNQNLIMSAKSKTYGSSSGIAVGQEISLSHALTYLLTRSSNDVANQIMNTHDALYGYQGQTFVQKMNQKAAEIGLVNTSFAGPSGLEAANVSTAFELARTIDYMRAQYPELLSLGRQPFVKRGNVELESSNPVHLQSGWLGGKNGYISKSGRTTASLFSVGDKEVIIVYLGSVLNDEGRDNQTLLSLVE